ncbi:MAG: hypothetical protein AAGF92_01005 [Myxococcota bacterium]
MVASCDRFPDNGIQVSGMLPFEDDCTVDPATNLRRSSGVWDIEFGLGGGVFALNGDYIVTPLLEGYFVSRALEIQAETNNFEVTNFDIWLLSPDDQPLVLPDTLPNPFRVPATAVLPATEDGTPSSAATGATGIPVAYATAVNDALAALNFNQVIVDMKAVGETRGGFTQISNSFRWPVRVCEGCLDLCAPGTPLTEEELQLLTDACAPGQDGFFWCSNEGLIPVPMEDAN